MYFFDSWFLVPGINRKASQGYPVEKRISSKSERVVLDGTLARSEAVLSACYLVGIIDKKKFLSLLHLNSLKSRSINIYCRRDLDCEIAISYVSVVPGVVDLSCGIS